MLALETRWGKSDGCLPALPLMPPGEHSKASLHSLLPLTQRREISLFLYSRQYGCLQFLTTENSQRFFCYVLLGNDRKGSNSPYIACTPKIIEKLVGLGVELVGICSMEFSCRMTLWLIGLIRVMLSTIIVPVVVVVVVVEERTSNSVIENPTTRGLAP